MHYYLIINEGLDNGLIQSQVINPIIFNGLKEEVGILSVERVGKFVRKPSDLNTQILPIGIPYRLYLFNNLAYILVPIIAFFYALILLLKVKKNDILIVRSYFPGIVAYYLRFLNGTKFKFDPRSLFIHESETKKLLKDGSRLYRWWLNWEKKILESCELVIVVAEKQGEYYKNIVEGNPLEIIHIPCYASGNFAISSKRSNLLKFSEHDIVIAYYGSLDGGWNNAEIYLSWFNQAILAGYKICIISQNHRELLKDARFVRDEIFIVDATNNKNHFDYLQVCDYGIVLMPKVSDWETRLSVKFAEYLSNGLGVLVGEYVGEAVRISEKFFKDTNLILKSGISLKLPAINHADKINISQKAKEIFGLHNFKKLMR